MQENVKNVIAKIYLLKYKDKEEAYIVGNVENGKNG